MKNIILIPLIAAAALVAVMAASALTMTQQAYANPCSITDNAEDKTVSDEGAQGADTSGNIGCDFADEVITFEPDSSPGAPTPTPTPTPIAIPTP
jgi:hypothetical protein